MPLTLSPALAERFTRIIALLCAIVAEQCARQRRDGPLTVLIHTRIRHLARRFLAHATVPAGPQENTPRAPRPPAERPPAAPRPRTVAADVPRLPHGRAWLLKLVPQAACTPSQLTALLADPEVTALLLARPWLARMLRPLCHALAMPPLPGLAPPRRRNPAPAFDPANPAHATGADTTGAAPRPPRKPRRRKLLWRRNEDLLFRLRMGTPLVEV